MRIVVISNRLPFTVGRENGELIFTPSVGGLATGVKSFLDKSGDTAARDDHIWIGWPGVYPSRTERETITREARKAHNSVPVFFTKGEMDRFYLGLCNRTIWPLFHYLPSYASFDDDLWEPYLAVNEAYCEAALQLLQPDDTVWIHDYHLMLLPQLLRERAPELSIGFFLHIPFPSFEIFRLLPQKWRTQLLQGLLGADLVGFHTYDYTQYFLRCVNRILGIDNDMGTVTLANRSVKVETFPMGVDFELFDRAQTRPDDVGRNRRTWTTSG